MGFRRSFALVFAVAFVAAGCNSRLIRPPVTIDVDGGESRVGTTINETRYHDPVAFHSFFPSTVPVHAGDTVRFAFQLSGEPHTVALGRLVDRAVAAVEALGPTAPLANIERLAEMRRIPAVFPHVVESGTSAQVNASASDPCFLDDGRPSVSRTGGADRCPERRQPDFTGRQAFYSSGVIEDGESFRVKLDGDMEPGTYRFMCLVHRSAMTGSIEVVPAEQDRPRVSEIRKRSRDDLRQAVNTLEPSERRAVARRSGPILAGTGPLGTTVGFVTAFIPDERTVETGEPVTWKFFQAHTISFGATGRANDGIIVHRNGSRVINLEAFRSRQSSALPSSALRYVPPKRDVAIDGGSWSGEGSFSSGVIRATPPADVTYTLRFTKPGEYRYVCLVHSRMRGRILVV